MYNSFFGFREKPFKLVPNPDFLFLSRSHEIALAHLSYATEQGDGFVVITGEVGTGKTTLCRIFLERLGAETESAYIFNPRLESVQLLTTICNEFGIRTNLTSIKDLLDVINGYLILKNQAGRKVILLIDEAQNLTVENLEMVRMLSNLETTRSKLLQIILVGQPELGDKLDSYELRQLAQRISLNCHLQPLSVKETEGYIRHRINIAAQRQLNVFSPGACRKIHRYAKGIPRLINIAADRALLTTYSLNRRKVTATIAQTAIRELSARGRLDSSRNLWKTCLWTGLVLFFLVLVGYLLIKADWISIRFNSAYSETDASPSKRQGLQSSSNQPQAFPQTYKVPPITAIPPPETSPGTAEPDQKSIVAVPEKQELDKDRLQSLDSRIMNLDPQKSRSDAVACLLGLWKQPVPTASQLPPITDDIVFFDICARQYGFRMLKIVHDWDAIKKINMPCILAFDYQNAKPPVYMTLVRMTDDRVYFQNDVTQGLFEAQKHAVEPYLTGDVYVVWKDLIGSDALITLGTHSHSVLALKKLLSEAGYNQFPPGPLFDRATQQVIVEFQRKYQLETDGLVGPLTKVLLINEVGVDFPHLEQPGEPGQ